MSFLKAFTIPKDGQIAHIMENLPDHRQGKIRIFMNGFYTNQLVLPTGEMKMSTLITQIMDGSFPPFSFVRASVFIKAPTYETKKNTSRQHGNLKIKRFPQQSNLYKIFC